MSREIVVDDGKYTIVKNDDKYSICVFGEALETAGHNELCTNSLKLAERIIEDIKIYGLGHAELDSILPWHSFIIDNYTSVSYQNAVDRLISQYLQNPDWTFVPKNNPEWANTFGTWEARRNSIISWIHRCSFIQLAAIECVGTAYGSINLAYTAAYELASKRGSTSGDLFVKLAQLVCDYTSYGNGFFSVLKNFEYYYEIGFEKSADDNRQKQNNHKYEDNVADMKSIIGFVSNKGIALEQREYSETDTSSQISLRWHNFTSGGGRLVLVVILNVVGILKSWPDYMQNNYYFEVSIASLSLFFLLQIIFSLIEIIPLGLAASRLKRWEKSGLLFLFIYHLVSLVFSWTMGLVKFDTTTVGIFVRSFVVCICEFIYYFKRFSLFRATSDRLRIRLYITSYVTSGLLWLISYIVSIEDFVPSFVTNCSNAFILIYLFVSVINILGLIKQRVIMNIVSAIGFIAIFALYADNYYDFTPRMIYGFLGFVAFLVFQLFWNNSRSVVAKNLSLIHFPEFKKSNRDYHRIPLISTSNKDVNVQGAEKIAEELRIYKKLLDEGAISTEDYEQKKVQILSRSR